MKIVHFIPFKIVRNAKMDIFIMNRNIKKIMKKLISHCKMMNILIYNRVKQILCIIDSNLNVLK